MEGFTTNKRQRVALYLHIKQY